MLTSKQRAYLRGRANDYDTIFQVGKGGISENMLEQIDNALEARELIKLRTLENSDLFAKEAAQTIAEELGADVVSVVGSRFILYRESEKNKKFDIVNFCEIEPTFLERKVGQRTFRKNRLNFLERKVGKRTFRKK